MIEINKLNYDIGERELFHELSLSFPHGHRIALVGRNGEGKTTLFRMITGQIKPTSGKIIISKNYKIGYLPQDLIELSNKTIREQILQSSGIASIENKMQSIEIRLKHAEENERTRLLKLYATLQHQHELFGGYAFESRMKEILMGLGFDEYDMDRMTHEFSGGWKMRIFLAQLLLNQPDALLMDEPTNHLDIESLEWLEGYLCQYKGLIVIISHDRYFLDKIVDNTIELERGKITRFPGTYTHYLSEKKKRNILIEREAEEIQKQIQKTQQFIDRFRYKANKAPQVQSRIKMLEKLKTQVPIIEKELKKVRIKFAHTGRNFQEVMKLENVYHAYGKNVVFDHINLTVERNDRIAFIGKNGSGKSTLTRLVSGIEKPLQGKAKIAENTEIGFFAQESVQNLNYHNTVLKEILSLKTPINEQQIRNLLGMFLFSGDDVDKPIKVLSGGEKSRLALCKILSQPFKVLVLDEPTNHLDEPTKEIFQQALTQFNGTLILVSHDRYFLDHLVKRIVEINHGKITEHIGNYASYIQHKNEQQAQLTSSENFNLLPNKQNQDNKKWDEKLRKREEAERRKELYVLKQQCQDIELKISNLETKKANNEAELCDPEIYHHPEKIKNLKLTIDIIQEQLKSFIEEWEKLSSKIENFRGA